MALEQIISGSASPVFELGSEDVRSLIEEFLLTRKTDRGCSEKTLVDYRGKLHLFSRFLRESGNPLAISDITRAQIRAFRAYLQQPSRWSGIGRQGRPLSDSSLAAYDRVLRTFFRWLVEEELITDNPMGKLKRPKVARKPMRFLSSKELEAIWATFDPKTAKGQRDRTLFLLLTDTGLRASELLSITVHNTNLTASTLTVVGKGGHTRHVGMSDITLQQVMTYVRKWRIKCALPNLLLLPDKRKPLTYYGMQMVFERWQRDSGIKVPFSAHSFRRTYATRAIQEGADGLLVAAQMGHTSLTMTKKYVQEAGLDLGVLQANHSPLRGLRL